jgi:hypothetical protein
MGKKSITNSPVQNDVCGIQLPLLDMFNDYLQAFEGTSRFYDPLWLSLYVFLPINTIATFYKHYYTRELLDFEVNKNLQGKSAQENGNNFQYSETSCCKNTFKQSSILQTQTNSMTPTPKTFSNLDAMPNIDNLLPRDLIPSPIMVSKELTTQYTTGASLKKSAQSEKNQKERNFAGIRQETSQTFER